MNFITVKDGTQIFFKDWAKANLLCSLTAGLSMQIAGILRCCSCGSAAIALLRMTVVATAAPVSRTKVTIWIPTQTI